MELSPCLVFQQVESWVETDWDAFINFIITQPKVSFFLIIRPWCSLCSWPFFHLVSLVWEWNNSREFPPPPFSHPPPFLFSWSISLFHNFLPLSRTPSFSSSQHDGQIIFSKLWVTKQQIELTEPSSSAIEARTRENERNVETADDVIKKDPVVETHSAVKFRVSVSILKKSGFRSPEQMARAWKAIG